jgi:hypothetical protein
VKSNTCSSPGQEFALTAGQQWAVYMIHNT